MSWALKFWFEERGQDIIEYSLLITFIAIACLALLGSGHPAIKGIWDLNTNHLQGAEVAASGG